MNNSTKKNIFLIVSDLKIQICLPGLSGFISSLWLNKPGCPGNSPGRGHIGNGAVVPWGPPAGGVKKGLKFGGKLDPGGAGGREWCGRWCGGADTGVRRPCEGMPPEDGCRSEVRGEEVGVGELLSMVRGVEEGSGVVGGLDKKGIGPLWLLVGGGSLSWGPTWRRSSCMPLTRRSSATRRREGSSSWDTLTSPLHKIY